MSSKKKEINTEQQKIGKAKSCTVNREHAGKADEDHAWAGELAWKTEEYVQIALHRLKHMTDCKVWKKKVSIENFICAENSLQKLEWMNLYSFFFSSWRNWSPAAYITRNTTEPSSGWRGMVGEVQEGGEHTSKGELLKKYKRLCFSSPNFLKSPKRKP